MKAKGYDAVDAIGLLRGVFTNIGNAPEATACNEETLRVFLSYSHKDEAPKERLEAHLSSLIQHGKIKV